MMLHKILAPGLIRPVMSTRWGCPGSEGLGFR